MEMHASYDVSIYQKNDSPVIVILLEKSKKSALGATAWLTNFSIQVLFPQILTRREPCHLLEEASEMMGKIEAQEA